MDERHIHKHTHTHIHTQTSSFTFIPRVICSFQFAHDSGLWEESKCPQAKHANSTENTQSHFEHQYSTLELFIVADPVSAKLSDTNILACKHNFRQLHEVQVHRVCILANSREYIYVYVHSFLSFCRLPSCKPF